jgi:hypothetical protein
MCDLKIAKERIDTFDYAIVIVKEGRILYESKAKGIRPLYMAYVTMLSDLEGATVVDRVTGRAAAMLCIGANIKQLHAKLLSERAIGLLDASSISYSYDVLTPYIKNRTQTDTCPVEKLSKGVTDVSLLVEKIKGFLEEMSK